MRRGVPSANAAYGNATAILVGDLLFGQASSLIADLGADAVRIQADTFVRLCAGQIRDDRPCPEGVDPVEYYLSVLRDKTGSLIATAARYGAIFAGCDATTVEVMAEYGERLGITFQLVDDLIDITSDGTVSGKTPAPTSARVSTPSPCCTRRRRPTLIRPGCASCSPPTCAMTTRPSARPSRCSGAAAR